jgi:hypothetical protein
MAVIYRVYSVIGWEGQDDFWLNVGMPWSMGCSEIP